MPGTPARDGGKICRSAVALFRGTGGGFAFGVHEVRPRGASAARCLDRKGKPDLVVIDISLEGGSGLDLIARLKQRACTAKILVLSAYDDTL